MITASDARERAKAGALTRHHIPSIDAAIERHADCGWPNKLSFPMPAGAEQKEIAETIARMYRREGWRVKVETPGAASKSCYLIFELPEKP